MQGFCPLASGSKGNSTFFGSRKTKLLIDAGLSAKATALRLAQLGVDVADIDAILITHEHTDHIRGLEQLVSKYQIPVFSNSDTARGIYEALGTCPKFKIFSTGDRFEFGDIAIHPFSISHDTADPVAFALQADGVKVGICTDLGFATPLVKSALQESDYLILEANHQPSMVHASSRPALYKQRVLSRQGHLSNEQCAELLLEVFHDGLRHVHLAHLSSECNSPELALKIIEERLLREGKKVPLAVAYQEKLSLSIRWE